MKSKGKYTMDKIPINLSDKIRNKLNVGKRYHSGRISNGVENGLAFSLMFKGSATAKPMIKDKIPKITTGKMYRISLGHAGSPLKLCPIPLDNFTHKAKLERQGNLMIEIRITSTRTFTTLIQEVFTRPHTEVFTGSTT